MQKTSLNAGTLAFSDSRRIESRGSSVPICAQPHLCAAAAAPRVLQCPVRMPPICVLPLWRQRACCSDRAARGESPHDM